jgi:hypothetical protein
VLPAAAFAQLDDMGAATLRQGVPSARNTVVRAGLPFRHEKKARSACPIRIRNGQGDACTRHTFTADTICGGNRKTAEVANLLDRTSPRNRSTSPRTETHLELAATQRKWAGRPTRPVHCSTLNKLILLISLWKKYRPVKSRFVGKPASSRIKSGAGFFRIMLREARAEVARFRRRCPAETAARKQRKSPPG